MWFHFHFCLPARFEIRMIETYLLIKLVFCSSFYVHPKDPTDVLNLNTQSKIFVSWTNHGVCHDIECS